MTVKERLHHLIEELDESDLLVAERMLRGLKAPPEETTNRMPISVEERRERLKAIRGKYAHVLPTVDEFLAEKHREKTQEDERWERRMGGKQCCGSFAVRIASEEGRTQ